MRKFSIRVSIQSLDHGPAESSEIHLPAQFAESIDEVVRQFSTETPQEMHDRLVKAQNDAVPLPEPKSAPTVVKTSETLPGASQEPPKAS